MRLHSRSRQGLALLGGIALLWPLVLGQGCPSPLPIPGGSSSGAPIVVVNAPSINQDVIIGSTITIVYDASSAVASSASAFYDRDGLPDTGDEITFAAGLSVGGNRFTQLNTTGLSAGNLHVGITATNAFGTTTIYAASTIRLIAAPNIVFSSPSAAMNIGSGIQIPVQFSAGQSNFSYRLFYVFNGNPVTISQGTSGTGSSVSVSTTWDTTNLMPGQYQLGVTVTTATGNQVTGYAPGMITVVLGSFIQILSPSIGLMAVPGDFVEVVLAANDPANTATQIQVFYDPDNTYGNGNEVTIGVISQRDGGLSWDTTDVSIGSYYVGAVLLNGQTTPPVSFSSGPVQITAGQGGSNVASISVRAPSRDTAVMEKSQYTLQWTASVAARTGKVTLYYDTDMNNDNVADGMLVQIVADLDPSLGEYVWTLPANLMDTVFIVAKLTMPDGTTTTAVSRGRLLVRQQFSWIGDVGADNARRIPGVVMRGFNFNDFAGSSFTPVSDIDGDGYDDFVVVSQFGKPRLNNPDGAGLGEAYLIYGNRALNNGPVDLNTTGELDQLGGLKGLNGVIMPGIGTVATPPATTVSGSDIVGIPSVLAIRDQDGDKHPELVIGYPKANNIRTGRLSKQGQFQRGGIIMVSSRNTRIKMPTSRDDNGSRVLDLARVGQNFTSYATTPFSYPNLWRCYPWITDNGTLDCKNCSSPMAWGDGPGYHPCADEEDPICSESVVDHGVGFMPSLVEDLADGPGGGQGFGTWQNAGCGYPRQVDSMGVYFWGQVMPAIPNGWFQILGSTCGHVSHLPEVDSNGNVTGRAYLSSGFYVGGSAEPFGMRMLGRANGDAFGQSIAVIDDRLLVGAPLRTAVFNEIENLGAARASSGVVYEIKIKTPNNVAETLYGYSDPMLGSAQVDPRPHQYIVVEGGNCGGSQGPTDSFTIVGARANEQIGFSVAGIADFNGDAKGDILIGSPNAFSTANGFNDSGAVYMIYRRTATAIEGDYDLGKIELDPGDRNRLHGFLVRGRANERLGNALAPGFDGNGDGVQEQLDYNQDGLPDVIIGNQNFSGGQGEVVILFGNLELVSPANGYDIDDLVNGGLACTIQGENGGDLAGFNVAYAGDFDGDGKPDLMISAPNASPQVDTNGDGVKETLTNAGLVYLLFGSNKLIAGSTYNLSDIRNGTLNGLIFAGRSTGDRLGGGQIASQVDDPVYGFGLLGMRARNLSWAGDVNNDGLSDILIGAPMASPYGKINAGEVYLVYGFRSR